MQSWCRTWPPNGSKHIRAKTKLHKKPREACKSSWNPRGSLKSFTLTIPWNLSRSVPIIPFGSLVEYHPITAKDQSRIHQCGKKVLPGLFLGYALYAGGIWKGDVLIADLEELETMDVSEIYAKRLNAKEVIFFKDNGKFTFPVAN